MFGAEKKLVMPSAADCLSGRSTPMPVAKAHYVNGHSLQGPFAEPLEQIILGLGCFWGAEKKFWELPGVYVTAVGYAAGYTPNPTYEEVCTGLTGHNEVVLVVYDTNKIQFLDVLKVFWQVHNPTQGMRQGNDHGTQYRSGIYTFNDTQFEQAKASRTEYGRVLSESGYAAITTEIMSASEFYYAEDYHQQYLAKNPRGYCGLGGTGVKYP